MPHKIAMNLAYASRASVPRDIAVIVRTVLHPLVGTAPRPGVLHADRQ
jgi:hypothetical protein